MIASFDTYLKQLLKIFVSDFQVAASIEPVLKAKHFEELVLASQDARNRLQDLGCFSDVEIHIDTSEDGGKSDYEVINFVMFTKMKFSLDEKPISNFELIN